MNGLSLHCGSNEVQRDQLALVPTPKATETWFPIPHTVLLDQVEETLEHNGLKIINQAHDLVIQALDAQVIPATKIPHVLNEWRDPRHPEFRQGKTAWRWFNAVTEVLKGSLDRLPRRTQALHGLLDAHCGLLTADPKIGLAAPQDAEFVQAV